VKGEKPTATSKICAIGTVFYTEHPELWGVPNSQKSGGGDIYRLRGRGDVEGRKGF